MHHDEFVFVQSIQNKFWLGMLASVDAALIATARGSTGERGPAGERRTAPVRPGSDAEFMRFLIAVREYLLSEGRTRPASLDDAHFALLKPLCEQLVSQGRFPHDRLQLFSGVGALPNGPEPRPSGPAQRRSDGLP